MHIHVVNATEVARSFSLLLNKVVEQGQVYDIQRGNEVIAKLIPVKINDGAIHTKELNNFFASLPPLEKEEWQDFGSDLKKFRRKLKLLDKNPWD
jgi:antitoxin (DNA-binding transcriptional repressor) of toxin-antitoxin stability system